MSTGYTDNRRQNNLLHKQETETPSNCTIRVSSLLRPHHRPHRACCSATTAIYKTYWHIYIGTKRTRSGLGREFIMGATQNDETRHSTSPLTQGDGNRGEWEEWALFRPFSSPEPSPGGPYSTISPAIRSTVAVSPRCYTSCHRRPRTGLYIGAYIRPYD